MIRFAAISVVFVGLAIPLGACTTQAQRDTSNEASCIKWGVQPGTPLFVECMITLRSVDAQVAQADAQRMMAAGAALQASGSALRAPDSVHCTSIKTGDITNTNCQ